LYSRLWNRSQYRGDCTLTYLAPCRIGRIFLQYGGHSVGWKCLLRTFPPYPFLETVPAQTDSIFAVQGAVMVNQVSRVRVSSNGKCRPKVDGSAIENELLLGLPSNEGDSIFSKLTFVQLRTHDVLHESEESIKFAYFMNSGLASILTV